MRPLLPDWTIGFGFFLGACFGSFLNMLIYRLPREGLSLGEPKRSFCPKCNHTLDWIDLFPLFSWLSTRGRCRYCHDPIAPRYFIVEMLNGAIFAGIWWTTMTGRADPNVIRFIAFALAACALVAIIFIDWELYIIPDELNAFLFLVGIVYGAVTGHIVASLIGALAGWGFIWGIQLLGRIAFGKDAMGDGDVKMMRGVGALIGSKLLLANIGIAVVLGIVGGLLGMMIAARATHKAPAATEGCLPADSSDGGAPKAEDQPSDVADEPTPIWVVFFCGLWYLLCLDIVALFVKPLDRWVTKRLPQEVVEEEDDWKPTATTIPFGPYLAAGAIICMLFGGQLNRGITAYLNRFVPTQGAATLRVHGDLAGSPRAFGRAEGSGVPDLSLSIAGE